MTTVKQRAAYRSSRYRNIDTAAPELWNLICDIIDAVDDIEVQVQWTSSHFDDPAEAKKRVNYLRGGITT